MRHRCALVGAGVPPTKRRADGEIVFAGYGVAPSRPKRDCCERWLLQWRTAPRGHGTRSAVVGC